MRFVLGLVLLVLAASLAQAQRGRHGGGGGGIVAAPMPVIMSVTGTLKQLDKKLIVLEVADQRTYLLRRSKKMAFYKGEEKIQAKDIDIESRVTVEMTEDHDLKLTAITLRLDPNQPPRAPKTRN